MNNFFHKLKLFFIELKNENKIPEQDKKTICFILLIFFLPILFIPEWNSSYGPIVSLFFLSFIPDYLFNILDQNIILSHYPFDLKSYNQIKRAGQFLAILSPSFISDFIWKYEKEIL
jgi:hypothetical protein